MPAASGHYGEGHMDIGTMIILGGVIGVALTIWQVSTANQRRSEISAAIGAVPEFSASFQHLGADGNNGIALDEPRAEVCLLTRVSGRLSYRVVGYRDILSAELFEDGQTITRTVRSSQVGGVLVGGLLLGGVGAIIGGLSGARTTAKGKVKRIDLRLVVNDASQPTHDVCFLFIETTRDGAIYKLAAEPARQWQARMDVLIKRADREYASGQPTSPTQVMQQAGSVSDELRKLADLRASGILTEAEFEKQKSKLLG